MTDLSQPRVKLLLGALALVAVVVVVLVWRRITPPAPQIRPGQTLEDPLGAGASAPAAAAPR